MNHAIYSDILQSLGWFDTGMGAPEALDKSFKQFLHEPLLKITDTTLIAYYPGCFAEFHQGHLAVVEQALDHLSKITDDYVVIIAPANADYTFSKYGDVVQASNKYRYDKIRRAVKGMERVMIDLNPMLNYDRDHNFPDLIEEFLQGWDLSLNTMKVAPLILSGKDRGYFSDIAKLTTKLGSLHVPGDDSSSSAIMKAKGEQPRVKKHLTLRCATKEQEYLFTSYFGDQYASVKGLLLEDEKQRARELIKNNFFNGTICKEYADLLPYRAVSRKWTNPLEQLAHHFYCEDVNEFSGALILDSDTFSGSTKRFIERLGGKLVAVLEANPETDEIIDYDDLVGRWWYPFVDISSRCSMQPFTKEMHKKFNDFQRDAMALQEQS